MSISNGSQEVQNSTSIETEMVHDYILDMLNALYKVACDNNVSELATLLKATCAMAELMR